jgi:hypothetical protein
VLDQAGDVRLVFDDEHAMLGHSVEHPQYRRDVSLSYRGS